MTWWATYHLHTDMYQSTKFEVYGVNDFQVIGCTSCAGRIYWLANHLNDLPTCTCKKTAVYHAFCKRGHKNSHTFALFCPVYKHDAYTDLHYSLALLVRWSIPVFHNFHQSIHGHCSQLCLHTLSLKPVLCIIRWLMSNTNMKVDTLIRYDSFTLAVHHFQMQSSAMLIFLTLSCINKFLSTKTVLWYLYMHMWF